MKSKYLDGVKNPHEQKIYKSFDSEIKVNDETKRTLVVTISTPDEDRSGDTMNMKGMQYNNFIKNPVVLFAHDYKSKPIAKCLSLQVTDKAAVATVEFTPKGLYEEADIIYELYKQGFLSAWSVGFRALDYDTNEFGGYNFKSWELFEFSSVPVPDNSAALTIMRSKGINVDKVLEKQEEVKSEGEEEIKEEDKPVEPEKKAVEEEKTEEKKEEPVEETPAEETKEVEEEPEKKEAEVVTKDADDPADNTPLSEVTFGQMKDLILDCLDGDDTDTDPDKSVGQVVKKDVEQVVALSYVLDTLSWFISMFEATEVSQSSIDKLVNAMGLVMQVVNEQAEIGKKSFNLADYPQTKEGVKLLAKAGRAISSANQDKLKQACDHMEKAVGHVQDVMGTKDEDTEDGKAFEPEKVKESEEEVKKQRAEAYLKKLEASLKSTHKKVTDQLKTSNQKQDATLSILKKLQLTKGGEIK